MVLENVMFIHVPKTAGLSIEKGLNLTVARTPGRFKNKFKNSGHYSLGHLDVVKRLKSGAISKEFYDSAFKFCFCRNPFDRAVSHYFYARKRHPDILSPKVSFLDFTRTLANFGKTFQCQSEYVKNLKFDFIGRYEKLQDDFRKIKKIIGIRGDLPQINSTNHKRYDKYYNEESANNIVRYYAEDFKRFGYDNRLLHVL